MTQQIEMTSDEDVRARVEDLLSRADPSEKAGQLTQYFYMGFMRDQAEDGAPTQPELVEAAMARGGVGSLLFLMDAGEINRLQKATIEGNRHGIPALVGFDVIHGFRTILPVPIALAASWDPALIEQGQAVAAREARAVGIHWAFAPMVDIARDPRWGRIIEGAGEDPYLGGQVAAAQVRGFQGARLGTPDRVIAGPKHFAGYGAALGGRDYDESNISDAELWNIYFPPFKAAIDAGAGNIMSAYMDLNGVPAAGNQWLLNDVLRDGLGFDGFVVSDAQAVHDLVTHHFAADLSDAAARALNAGNDMEMTFVDPAFDHLVAAVEDGRVIDRDARHRRPPGARGEGPPRSVREPVRRRGRGSAGAGRPRPPRGRQDRRPALGRAAPQRRRPPPAEHRPARLDRRHRAAGRLPARHPRARGSSTTTCPRPSPSWTASEPGSGSRPRSASLPAFGPRSARSPRCSTCGRATPRGPGGLRRRRRDRQGRRAGREQRRRVLVAGEWQNMIGESASRSSLELPGRQLELIQAVVATGTPTVLLVMNGRPLDLRWPAENVPAILDVWYPGSQGGHAVAALLFGDDSPAGKLPFSWPRTVGQVPMIYNHTRSHEPDDQGRRYWDEESTPLFPFGHGLGYGSFSLRRADAQLPTASPSATPSTVSGHRAPTTGSAARPRRSSSSTCTSGTAPPPARFAS